MLRMTEPGAYGYSDRLLESVAWMKRSVIRESPGLMRPPPGDELTRLDNHAPSMGLKAGLSRRRDVGQTFMSERGRQTPAIQTFTR